MVLARYSARCCGRDGVRAGKLEVTVEMGESVLDFPVHWLPGGVSRGNIRHELLGIS